MNAKYHFIKSKSGLSSAFALVELLCEVCRRSPAKRDDILCAECSHYYTLLIELLDKDPHPDFGRLAQMFEWRKAKTGTTQYA